MRLEDAKKVFDAIYRELDKVIVGQKEVLQQLLITLLCDGHAIIEGYPGLAKTLIAKSIAQLLDLKFSRIQSTPDLMPSDIIGTQVLEERDGKKAFKFQPGPVFANIVLVDEINRATPKTQSALLEAMQERQVTVAGTSHLLERPFLVLATENPIEMEGVFPLPEAQRDRFLMKILIDYPAFDEEIEIVDRYTESRPPELKKLLSRQSLVELQQLVTQVPIANDIKKHAIGLVAATRKNSDIEYGASPRASIALILAAKARALLQGRKYVSKEDISALAKPVLRHRIVLNFEAERQGKTEDDVISALIK